jgi:hypothetical protein
MLKKTVVWIAIVWCFSCQARRLDLTPPAGPYFQSLTIKVRFSDGSVRQNGRIHWRFDDDFSKFLFFTPLNQVGSELDVAGEDAMLVNFSKKTFWRGDFSRMLDRLWGIELHLADLKQLLLKGAIPKAELAAKGIAVALEGKGPSGLPRTVRLRRGASDLTLSMGKSEYRPGKIILIDYSGRYQAAELESVLGDD